jgi:(p)ppGpp synthase/HD superfamily hydrolase
MQEQVLMELIPNFARVHAALKEWAANLHAANGQTWAVDKPYSAHLAAVEGVLDQFGYTDMENPFHQVLHLAAQAHDLLGDTKTTRTTLRVLQGPDVEGLVWAVTDEPGANRADQHLKTYPKIAGTPGAMVLELADRIANVQASITWGPLRMLEMYRKEYPSALSRIGRGLLSKSRPPAHAWAYVRPLIAAALQNRPPSGATLVS